jgi:hypothetical protein
MCSWSGRALSSPLKASSVNRSGHVVRQNGAPARSERCARPRVVATTPQALIGRPAPMRRAVSQCGTAGVSHVCTGRWPTAFQLAVLAVPRRPCPFADGRYQLMRNLAFASEFARWAGLAGFGFIVAHVAGARSAHHTEELAEEFATMLLPDARRRFGLVSYERIAETQEKPETLVSRHSLTTGSRKASRLGDVRCAKAPLLCPSLVAIDPTRAMDEPTPPAAIRYPLAPRVARRCRGTIRWSVSHRVRCRSC